MLGQITVSISLEQSVCINKRNSTKNYYVNKGCGFCHVRLEVVMTGHKFFYHILRAFCLGFILKNKMSNGTRHLQGT